MALRASSMRSVRQLHVSHCQQKVLAAALQPHARPALQVVPDLLAKAGARKIRFTAPVGQLREREALWTFDSVEVLALAMNAVRGDKRRCTLSESTWKTGKKLLARALVSTASELGPMLEALATTTAEQRSFVSKGKRQQALQESSSLTVSASPPPSLDSQIGAVLDELHAWTLKVQAAHDWHIMRKVLVQITEAAPVPPPQVQRDGSQGEAWACRKLSACLPPGWSLQPGVQLDFSQHNEEGLVSIRGVKGEADALIVDPMGTCQGVIEIKLGGSMPYRSIYNDVNKLRRMMAHVSGACIPVVANPMADPTLLTEGLATIQGQQDVQFSPTCTPYYLVLREGEPMDGYEVLQEAEQALTRINLSRALGSSAKLWRQVRLASIDQHFTELGIPDALVATMRQKTAKDFMSTLQAVDVWEMPPGPGDVWAW